MAVDGLGGPRDHAALTGLAVGDPHPQYAYDAQGLDAEKPAQPVRLGYRYFATDTKVEYRSDGSSWHALGPYAHQQDSPTNNDVDGRAPGQYPLGATYEGCWSQTLNRPGSNGALVTVRSRNHSSHTTQLYYEVLGLQRTWRRSAIDDVAWGGWAQNQVVDDSGWIEMLGWVNGTSAYSSGLGNSWTPRYRKLNGIVMMQGLFNGGAVTANHHVYTLPAGYRPGTGESMFDVSHTATGIRRMDISTSGIMTLREQFAGVATTGWHNLSSVQFVQEN